MTFRHIMALLNSAVSRKRPKSHSLGEAPATTLNEEPTVDRGAKQLPGSLCALLLCAFIGLPAQAAPVALSYQGSLVGTDDSTSGLVQFTLAGTATVTLQTWGFGGGTNAAGANIAAGGFDPFLSVFAGTGSSASFLAGSSDIMTDYATYAGCPPAGLVSIGGVAGCGDMRISLQLLAGDYTVLLTAGAYIPGAAFAAPGDGTLGDGFFDLTGGAFQTCTGDACIETTSAWALDIGIGDPSTDPTDPTGPNPTVPEPSSLALSGVALAALVHRHTRRRDRRTSKTD